MRKLNFNCRGKCRPRQVVWKQPNRNKQRGNVINVYEGKPIGDQNVMGSVGNENGTI